MSNLAKDWQTGTYVVSVYNNRVKVSRPKQGNDKPFVEAEARCAPEDEFSLSMGMALAMARLNKELSKNKIEVGDKVKIKDISKVYPTYISWLTKNLYGVGDIARYAYGCRPFLDEFYRILVIAPHSLDNNKKLAYIEPFESVTKPCYLIEVDGLEKV
nr:MAG TPA: hypothetical protein [Caudoviricetes sp.]